MIEQLNFDKLIEYDFATENIDRLKNWDKYEIILKVIFGLQILNKKSIQEKKL